LKQEERLRNHLSRYIGENLVDQIINTNGGFIQQNERKTITVMFADIRSFTSISESMTPEDVVTMLNEYLRIMVDIVFTNNGMLDKFAGDQIMAVFGHMNNEEEGIDDALKTALAMQQATATLMEKRKRKGLTTFTVGIGINTGSVIIGHVGSENRMDYTVIGDTVNIAAKMEELASSGEIIIGEKTFHRRPKTMKVDKKINLSLKNRKEPVICYRLIKSKYSSQDG
jgi:class 3 adenylate cyclase